jgi:hypothetical protein
MRTQERLNLTRRVGEQMKISKVSNITKNKKTAGIRKYSITILHVKALNSPIKRHRMADYIETRPNHLLPIRHTSHWQRQTQG